MNSTVNVVAGLAVLALLVVRQIRKRPLREDPRPVVLVVLLVLGILQLGTYLKVVPASAAVIALLVATLLLGAGFGAVRAWSVRIWREDGQLWRQGSRLTAVLWLVGFGVHIGLDALFDGVAHGLGVGSILLYLAVSLGVQRLFVQSRASRLGSFA
ncbi:DUF1453 family protein [Amycolatopsis vastitatis]|uniref:DUF1453 domain-containing protein n=1 Tax=Amycolatopsis vastitatis TaxID=1905142 RepID=A0A229TKG0_9PSEU|nr:DUF1453 family protein [Amycolatopsis vastitatis]OXM71658.1 hypothetical protein CF165_00965 [Amycolatopsis vastitatis]